MQNIKLTLAYDGTKYFGWQKTQVGPSVEATLQRVIEKILQHPIILQAAGRTDAGVHANGQVVNFLTTHSELNLCEFQKSVNQLLPKDVAVLDSKCVPLTFHPTLDCRAKEYHYYLSFGPVQIPFYRHYAWHLFADLDLSLIDEALILLKGQHNFSAFCNFKKNARYTSYMREIQDIRIDKLENHQLRIAVLGNNFLYKMVRNIVGTLVYIGQKKLELSLLPKLLLGGKRKEAGITAPAHGLFLYQVFYDKSIA